MAFITRFSARLHRLIGTAAVAALFAIGAPCSAGSIEAHKAVAFFDSDRIEISARFSINLPPELETALHNGLALPFEFEFELTRPKLYTLMRYSLWFGPTASTTKRLSYQPLTRQYRVHTGGISRNFKSLSEALSAVGIISAWSVLANTSVASDSDSFAGRLRLKLDLSQLPKPYQMAAIGHSEWSLVSSWAELFVTDQKTLGQEIVPQ